jgi:hypothetical protein
MEHRWNLRTPVEVNVTLNYSKLGLITAKTRDLSLGGAYVKADSVNLGKHAMVEVLFPSKRNGADDLVNVSATVVRSDSRGLALQFTDFEPQSIATLTGIMNKAGATQF